MKMAGNCPCPRSRFPWTIQIPAGQNGIPMLSGEVTARSYVMLSERHRFVPRTLKVFLSAAMAEVLDF